MFHSFCFYPLSLADSAWEMKSTGRMKNSAKAPRTRRTFTSVAIFAALFVSASLITVARSQENELFQCPEGKIFFQIKYPTSFPLDYVATIGMCPDIEQFDNVAAVDLLLFPL
jgi:hypothetical protein